MGARLTFAIGPEHSGGPTIVRFSEQHHITTIQAWVSGLIVMVLCEVGTRVGTLLVRVAGAKRAASRSVASAAGFQLAAVGVRPMRGLGAEAREVV